MKRTNARKIKSEVDNLINLGQSGNEIICAGKLQGKIRNLEYISDMLGELRIIAKKQNELPLVYFLEMAIMETCDSADVLKFKNDVSDKT